MSKKKVALIIALAVVACIFATVANASYIHTVKISVDCGKPGQRTVEVINNEYVITLFLHTHPSAVVGDCPVVVVTPPPVVTPPQDTTPNKMYLCYSHFGTETNPAAFDWDYGMWLWHNKALTGTWFLPVAVPGNVNPLDGNNIGAYHIVCNPASTRTATGMGVGGSGDVYDSKTTAAYDVEYTIQFGADFQVWHIYK